MGNNISKLLIVALLLAHSTLGMASETHAREYKIKAAYLYNLIKFINWPSASAPTTSTHICIIGENLFGQNLEKLAQRKAKGLPITVSHQAKEFSDTGCHIVFISRDSNSEQLLPSLANSTSLIVGEQKQFIEQGGLISLVVINNNIQLQINLTKAKATGYEVSGNLLEIAKIIK